MIADWYIMVQILPTVFRFCKSPSPGGLVLMVLHRTPVYLELET